MPEPITAVLLFLVLLFANGIQAITGFAGMLLAMLPCIRLIGTDFIVALGGGSSMDCAKAASVVCLTGESITKYHGTGVPVLPEHLPILAVPTTAGTGSEVTCVSVLTNHAEGKKCPINSNSFYPAINENDLATVLTPAGGIFHALRVPGHEVAFKLIRRLHA